MRGRGLLCALAALGSAVLVASTAASAPPRVGSDFYLVQPDPRLCPSPRCGGYWVQLVNHTRTRCSDGSFSARCYVARAVDEERHPLAEGLPAGSLVRAEIEPWSFEGLGELAVLVTARVFPPLGGRSASGRYFRVVDRGIRCVRAPCFSLRATLLNRGERITLSGIGLGGAPVGERARIEAALGTNDGVLARGRVVRIDGGRVLRASRFYLPSKG